MEAAVLLTLLRKICILESKLNPQSLSADKIRETQVKGFNGIAIAEKLSQTWPVSPYSAYRV